MHRVCANTNGFVLYRWYKKLEHLFSSSNILSHVKVTLYLWCGSRLSTMHQPQCGAAALTCVPFSSRWLSFYLLFCFMLYPSSWDLLISSFFPSLVCRLSLGLGQVQCAWTLVEHQSVRWRAKDRVGPGTVASSPFTVCKLCFKLHPHLVTRDSSLKGFGDYLKCHRRVTGYTRYRYTFVPTGVPRYALDIVLLLVLNIKFARLVHLQ